MQHRAHRHEQKRFVNNVAKRMGGRSVDRQFRSDANSDDHKPQLIVEAVRQHSAKIVFNYSKYDREQCHRAADPNQLFGSSKTAAQRIDRKLRRKRTKKNGARWCSFRV